MADYFSNIINRSANYHSDALEPVQFLEQNSNIDFEEIVEENSALNTNFDTDNSEKKTIESPINIDHKHSINNKTSNYFINSYERNIDKNEPSILINHELNSNVNFQNEATDTQIQEKTNFVTYNEEFKEISIINPKSTTIYFEKNNPNPIEDRNIENDLIENNKTEQIILEEKHFFLQPNSNKNQLINDLKNSEIHTETIKDILLPQKQSEILEKTENRNEGSKLTIGKINVEILPVAPPATKVINQIIQAPAPTTFSKTNRNSFGLGQL